MKFLPYIPILSSKQKYKQSKGYHRAEERGQGGRRKNNYTP